MKRRNFIKTTTSAGIGLSLLNPVSSFSQNFDRPKKRVGIIGLDTSHSIGFTEALNGAAPDTAYGGYRIVAAYPKGSNDIESSYKRIPEYTQKVIGLGVQIVDSIEELLTKVDVVLLETNDGRLHLEQAMPVIKAGKPMFIDKPMTASLSDAMTIFKEAEKYKVPVFSSSSLRFTENAQAIASGKYGKVYSANTYSPADIEKTHSDLFWYGIHGVEPLFTVMGTGCQSVVRVHTAGADVVVGTWENGHIGTFCGMRYPGTGYGGTVFCEKGTTTVGPFAGYGLLLEAIVKFFDTGIPPVKADETLEILAFMEAADESKNSGGVPVNLDAIRERAQKKARRYKG